MKVQHVLSEVCRQHVDLGQKSLGPTTHNYVALEGDDLCRWAGLSPMLLGYRQRAGETAIVMALRGVFGADEAARRSNLIRLNQAFGRLE